MRQINSASGKTLRPSLSLYCFVLLTVCLCYTLLAVGIFHSKPVVDLRDASGLPQDPADYQKEHNVVRRGLLGANYAQIMQQRQPPGNHVDVERLRPKPSNVSEQ